MLPTQDQKLNDSGNAKSPKTPDRSTSSVSVSNDNSRNFNSSISVTSTPIRSKCSTPQHSRHSTPFQSRTSTPLQSRTSTPFQSRTSTPFNSTSNNSSFCSNSPTADCSSNSIKLLEKRLTSKEPKSLQLSDFLVTKEKQGKQKKKKRIPLVPCENAKPKEIEPVSPPSASTSKRNCDKSQDYSFGDNLTQETVSEVKTESVIASRDSDKECHLIAKQNSSTEPTTPLTKPKKPQPHLSTIKQKHVHLIRSLALLYSACIASNLMQDLLKELNYVISLLMADTKTKNNYNRPCHCEQISTEEMLTDNKDLCLFAINSEAMYFASVVLEDQWQLLRYLNVSTLNAFCQNASLDLLVPNFVRRIKNFLHVSFQCQKDGANISRCPGKITNFGRICGTITLKFFCNWCLAFPKFFLFLKNELKACAKFVFEKVQKRLREKF